MSEVREKLVAAKKKLIDALGDNEKAYWSNMKSWFKQRITKGEFDIEARKLLPNDATRLHNEFLLAVLTKCHIPSLTTPKEVPSTQTVGKLKEAKRLQAIKRKYDHRFSVNPVHVAPPLAPVTSQGDKSAPAAQQPIKFCAKSLLMPSVVEMKNYVAIISWEMGLDDASDDVITFATQAVQVFIKNLLSAIFSRRSAYKSLRRTFKYAMGCQPVNPYLKIKQSSARSESSNCGIKLSFDAKEQSRIEDLGMEAPDSAIAEKYPVNMYDLHHTLKVFGHDIIPSHTVYALASERIVTSLWHPNHEEIQQDDVITGMNIGT